MIDLDLDTVNILLEKIRRRQKQIYSIALTQMIENEITSYHITFSAYISASTFYNSKINVSINDSTNVKITFFHRNALLLESKNFRQMQKLSHKADFNQVIYTKITALRVKNTWKKISINNVSSKVIISTMWVFKYKFDENDFLIKNKIRLCAKDDL
jgi:hypothetical protein